MDQLSAFQQTSFYEYITFVASSMLFSVLFFLGIAQYNYVTGEFSFIIDISEISTGIVVLGFIIFYLISHIYGQTISAVSEKIIGKPLKWLNKKVLKHQDFKGSFKHITSKIDVINNLPENKKNNKWTIIYYILSKNQDVGTDLLRRYAREKVSRVNSMNFLILLLVSIFAKFHPLCQGEDCHSVFYYWITTIILFICFLISCYEYFQRKCWNSDLIIKTAPVFLT